MQTQSTLLTNLLTTKLDMNKSILYFYSSIHGFRLVGLVWFRILPGGFPRFFTDIFREIKLNKC